MDGQTVPSPTSVTKMTWLRAFWMGEKTKKDPPQECMQTTRPCVRRAT